MTYTDFAAGGPMTFRFTESAPATPGEQNDKLRGMALDSPAKELDNISQNATRGAADLSDLSDRAAHAARQLRQLRPMLPTRDEIRKRRNR